MQSAVSSNWKPMEQDESPLPVHFAQINQRDGFFLVAREPDAEFEWKKLAGQTVLADHAAQPLMMLKYAARLNGVEWASVNAVDAGTPEDMVRAFRRGVASTSICNRRTPTNWSATASGYMVSSVGASMPPVAFSSLCCSRDFATTDTFRRFVDAYAEAREWVRTAPAEEVARAEASFFEGYSMEALAAGIERYRALGCWNGGVEIPRDLYEQALNVFESEGGITDRHPYEQVCLEA